MFQEAQVCVFGSNKNGLACKGSDLDVTLLISSYLAENRHKQQVMPKIVAKQLSRTSKQHQQSKNSSSHSNSNSNSTENDDVELCDEEEQQHVEEDVSEQHVDNSVDSNLKECVVRFFVS